MKMNEELSINERSMLCKRVVVSSSLHYCCDIVPREGWLATTAVGKRPHRWDAFAVVGR